MIEAQTAAILQQALTASPTAATGPTPSGPQICGQGLGIGGGVAKLNEMAWDDTNGALVVIGAGTNLSVCSKCISTQLQHRIHSNYILIFYY